MKVFAKDLTLDKHQTTRQIKNIAVFRLHSNKVQAMFLFSAVNLPSIIMINLLFDQEIIYI